MQKISKMKESLESELNNQLDLLKIKYLNTYSEMSPTMDADLRTKCHRTFQSALLNIEYEVLKIIKRNESEVQKLFD